ncbi:PREDICTED: armadillo repeat-containing protein 3 [Propithecus coquereli]|uniref:armadillo repeat-containing protein 3 n=1 Tax=Propithecus coquereli TaxID=379532 RepID=UPI00063F081A|nr:PREDICTED: armadillo repeat-containing protein 3 [Propithecus coquereli]
MMLIQQNGSLKKLLSFAENSAIPDVQKNAAKAITKAAYDEEIVIHEFASLCLANMSVEYTGKVQIFEHGGLEPLVRLLSSPDPDVKKNSIECIYNLVQDFQCRITLQELNAMPSILELLKSEYPIIQLLALKTLGVITNDKEARVMLRDTQGLDHLLKILEAKSSFLMFGKVVQLTIQRRNIGDSDVRKLLRELEVMSSVVAQLAPEAENRKLFHEQEVEKCLVTLLGSENDGTKVAASQAISAMCENSASKDFFNNQGIPQLVQLLKSDNEEVTEAAALALANLTTCNSINAKAAAEADGIDPLINVLSSKRDGAIVNAATVLTNMATQEPLRVSIQSHDIMHAIISPLHSANTVVQSKAALTVAATACDVEARTEVGGGGGFRLSISILPSGSKAGIEMGTQCWIACIKQIMPFAFIDRALDILDEVNLSVSRKNKFSEAAYNKLLNNNLPLKYSQTGYLSSGNIISDGFYDYGRINPGTKLLPLKELCLQEPSDLRAVLLINTKSSDISPPLSMEDKSSDIAYGRSVSSLSSLRRSSREKTNAGFGSPTEEKSEPTSGRNTVLSKSAAKEKGSSCLAHLVLTQRHNPALADRVGLGCSLVRGEYGRAWNEVTLLHERKGLTGALAPPDVYIVDLVFHPGALMKLRSRDADLYRFL